MIDFRYHLVSIIAIFLALALGIVVGTAALNGPIVDNLRGNINRLTDDKRTLEADLRGLQAQVAAADAFAQAVGPGLVEGRLAEQRVLLVTSPGTPDGLAEALRPLLTAAGASVAGSLEVLPTLGAPSSRALLDDLVAQVVPAGIELPDDGPLSRAAAELAAALTSGPDAEPIDADEAQSIVSAFSEADLVSFTAEQGEQAQALRGATLVVVLAPQGPLRALDDEERAQQQALVEVARAMARRSAGLVVAGPAGTALEGGLVAAVRGESGAAGELSTVDNVDRGTGQVAVVLALAEQAAGRSGQYGTGPGAREPLPAVATS